MDKFLAITLCSRQAGGGSAHGQHMTKRRGSRSRQEVTWLRPVTADHVLFEEAIAAYRPGASLLAPGPPVTHGYVLLDWALTEPIETDVFTLMPTERIDFAGARAAFVAQLALGDGHSRLSAFHFSVAGAALISLALGRPVRTGDSIDRVPSQLALHFPVLIAGPGLHEWQIARETLARYREAIQAVVRVVDLLPNDEYPRVMRAARLVQLAHNHVKEDFSLGYYLLVSAIEVMATQAISREEVRVEHPREREWREKGRSDPSIKVLYEAYREERGRNQYIRKRFLEFVLRYCPPSMWTELDDPLANEEAVLRELSPGWASSRPRLPFDVSPADLPEAAVTEALGNLYTYRSGFTHKGEAPPHRSPISHNRYFDLER